MGFPLSTDIFGQLKWLVKQVKLLVYRVTKIEQGGGGGAQNLNQVLATGNTATDKTLKIINNSCSTELFGNYLKVQASAPILANTMYGYQQIEMLTDNNTFIVLGVGGGYNTGGISFTNGSNQLVADSTQTTLSSVNISTGTTNSFLSNSYYLQFTEIDSNNNSIYAYYGRSQIAMYDSAGSSTLNIGRVEGYLGALGFTISNGGGRFVSCDTTQYIVKSDVATNKLTATGISIVSPDASKNVGLSFNPVDRIMSTVVDDVDYGFFLDQPNGICALGNISTDYFGIDTTNHRLTGSSSLQQSGTYNNPAGFVEILINGNQYWIELWN